MPIHKITLPVYVLDDESTEDNTVFDVFTLSRYLTLSQMHILMNIFSSRMQVHNYIPMDDDDDYGIHISVNVSTLQINNPIHPDELVLGD